MLTPARHLSTYDAIGVPPHNDHAAFGGYAQIAVIARWSTERANTTLQCDSKSGKSGLQLKACLPRKMPKTCRDQPFISGATNGVDPALLAGVTMSRHLHRGRTVMQIVRIGSDLPAYVFEIYGVDAYGKTVVRKTLRRHAVSTFFANLPPCLVGMEASNGAHFWAEALSELGHDVRLISPQFVAPYVKSNKNDRNNAEAICEAVGRTNSASCRSSPPSSWRCRQFIGFAVAWLPIASGSSIRSAVFSGSTASSLRRTSAIWGELWRGSATMRTALSIPWFAL